MQSVNSLLGFVAKCFAVAIVLVLIGQVVASIELAILALSMARP